ncbi:MAG TPA: glycosylase [Planctomycetaceae bacterium]|nr:glycosylase [Planctomycetaceae bacterium]
MICTLANCRFSLAAITVAALLTSLARATEPFPRELVEFTEYQSNPVFSGTSLNTWDHKIRERGYILRHEGKWHLWYTGYTGERSATKSLGYATSDDGLTWKRFPCNPVFDESWTEDVHVVRHEDNFYLVAEGKDDIPHMLTSPDGVNWKSAGRLDVRRVDGSAISPGPYGTPTLFIEKGTWYLFYERRDRGVWLATSRDRKVWTNIQDSPVLDRGPDAYDRHAIALNQVLKYKQRYYCVYHANADPKWKGPWTTCLAVSDDLIHWEKYSENPLIGSDDSSGQLIHDGQRFRLYTAHPDVRVRFSTHPSIGGDSE